ncbi:hypothetical protein QEH68_06745 [Paenarthrobacter sp. OM7]|uniref:hypothetical protein n=1 Tax=Paenarthrobacter sp. OM7 TaxID=3041264 RepID=UPI002469632A|nr:hypothetical protein [Paenarthrobacter sp. OM7]WGM21866.1 hypothetical protein QEH68_06745 [Paenarthrobacter sp. OM7]
MALALTAYEEGLCPGCGLHHSVTRGDHNVGRHEADDQVICHGCAPLESKRADTNRVTFPGQKITLHEADGWA